MSEPVSTGVALITVEAVELKLTTILTILWTTFGIMTVVAGALYWRGRRAATAAPSPADSSPATPSPAVSSPAAPSPAASSPASAAAPSPAPAGVPSPRTPSSHAGPSPDAADLEDAHRTWLEGLAGSTNWEHLSDSGRHHLPDELLEVSTYQLGPDRVARAKVPDQN